VADGEHRIWLCSMQLQLRANAREQHREQLGEMVVTPIEPQGSVGN
jgi:hypothetical protein